MSLDSIKIFTEDFFNRHWNESILKRERPSWTTPWLFKGTLPNHDKQGCYVLLSRRGVIYVGVGASIVGGIYKGHGLGSRTKRYYRLVPGGRSLPCNERLYTPTELWERRGLNGISTIGFDIGFGYLASSLESYILSKFILPFNKSMPGDGNSTGT